MLLALDIATTVGVAFGNVAGGRPQSLFWKCPEGPENLDRALVGLRESVMGFCKFNAVEVVVIEAALVRIDQFHGAYAAFRLISLSAVAREAASRHGARVVLVTCQKWRKSFIGHGNLPGAEAKAAAKARCAQFGWPFPNEDAAEAMGIWHWAASTQFRGYQPRTGTVAA
jgi:hypothetical protein